MLVDVSWIEYRNSISRLDLSFSKCKVIEKLAVCANVFLFFQPLKPSIQRWVRLGIIEDVIFTLRENVNL